jgi:hypothetical protein
MREKEMPQAGETPLHLRLKVGQTTPARLEVS